MTGKIFLDCNLTQLQKKIVPHLCFKDFIVTNFTSLCQNINCFFI